MGAASFVYRHMREKRISLPKQRYEMNEIMRNCRKKRNSMQKNEDIRKKMRQGSCNTQGSYIKYSHMNII